MLIVNADDWGRSKEATDSAVACYQHGRISSTSAMVFMADSERAAKVANECGIDVGLHLNFSEAFSAAQVPRDIAEAQRKVRRFLCSNKFALVFYHPFLQREFRFLFQKQLDEFRSLFAKEPSHIDGHQHMHLSTNMLWDEVIPRTTKVRRSFSFERGEKNIIQLTYRRLVDRSVTRRYRTTNYFLALVQHLSAERMRQVAALARNHAVELMTHPQVQKEYDALMSAEFVDAFRELRLGTYSEL